MLVVNSLRGPNRGCWWRDSNLWRCTGPKYKLKLDKIKHIWGPTSKYIYIFFVSISHPCLGYLKAVHHPKYFKKNDPVLQLQYSKILQWLLCWGPCESRPGTRIWEKIEYFNPSSICAIATTISTHLSRIEMSYHPQSTTWLFIIIIYLHIQT